MFDAVLGTKIIKTSDDRNIIGTVHLDTISETIRIDFPLGIRSKSLKSSDTGEIFKLEMYTLSEFTGQKSSIIINSSRWIEIIEPKEDILHEYTRISKGINDTTDFRSINMDEILDTYEDDPRENFKGIRREDLPPNLIESIDDFMSGIFGDNKNIGKKERKFPKIRDRWVDKL